MNRRILLIFIIATMIFTGFIGVWADLGDNITTELKENLIPLETTLPENRLDDLMPLKEILKDKRIIGMGEATHGTAEFFQMKHRMLEFLVKEMDYRAFAMEVDFGTTSIINNYISGKGGTLQRCMDTLGMWTWNTKEVADMITWMKEYNEGANTDEKIRFYGLDMQSINNALTYVFDYLSSVGSRPTEGYTSNLNQTWMRRLDPIEKGREEGFKKDIDKMHKELIENKDIYINNSSLEEYDLVLYHIETIYQYLNFIEADLTEIFDIRDRYMVENVKWILNYEKEHYGNDRIMLWTHNGHIINEKNPNVTLGSNLKDIYGDEYYSIGFDFYRGGFVANDSPITPLLASPTLSNFHMDSTEKGSFAHQMMKTGLPISFIDFKGVRDNEILLDFLSKRIHVNNIGAAYTGPLSDMSPYNKIILKDSFDSMIFIESTTGAERFDSRNELPDGNKSITTRNIFYTILVITGLLGIAISAFKIAKNPKLEKENQYYILNKNDKDSVDKKGLSGLIVKINSYFNSISAIKYWIFVVLALTLLSIIFNIINGIETYYMLRYSNIIFLVVILFSGIVLEFIEVFLCFILPFKIVKSKLAHKLSNLNQIIIAAIIGTIISILGHLLLGYGLSSLSISIFLIFIKAVIYCYSYDFFYTKDGKPISHFILLLTFVNILMLLANI